MGEAEDGAILGFKAFRSANVTIAGIKNIRMIRKGQVYSINGGSLVAQFVALVA